MKLKGGGSEMKCQELRNDEAKGKLTLSDNCHLGLQQNLMLEVDDLALVRVHDLQRRVDN